VHTLQDPVTGWRDPKPYSFTEIAAGNGDWAILEDRTSCPAWRTEGLAKSAANIFTFGTINGTTPFDRLGGLPRQNLINWVVTKALQKLNRFQVNLGATWGERKQTGDMLLEAIRDMVGFWRDVRRGNVRGLAHTAMNLDPWNLYLQYRYGVKPLLSDIEGNLARIETEENGSYRQLFVTVHARQRVSYQDAYTITGKGNIDVRIGGMELAKCRFDFYNANPDYVRLASLGLGLQTPWELVPFSFVVDWALNVGKFLEAATITPGFDYKSGSITTVGLYQGFGQLKPGTWPVHYGYGPQYEAFTFKREIPASAPCPRLAVNPQMLQDMLNNNSARIFDAVGLLKQQYSAHNAWRQARKVRR